ncbi:MAG: HNH endonuclease [Vulcanococcus sp.]
MLFGRVPGFAHCAARRCLPTAAATARRSAARSNTACARAKGRRECCGAHEHQRVLEVDHIVPRNHGGTGDLSNLQALCFRCNAGKRRLARGRLCVLRFGGQRPCAAYVPCGRRAGAAPAGVECRGGAAEAAAGAAQCQRRLDQRLAWFAQRKRGGDHGCTLRVDQEACRSRTCEGHC